MDAEAASLLALVEQLQQSGIRLWTDGERLRCSAPAETLSREIVTTLREQRARLIALLHRAEGGDADATAAASSPPVPAMPLTRAQRDMLPLARARADTGIYHVPLAFDLHGPLDVPALREALAAVENQHPWLRASFPIGDRPACRPPGSWPGFEHFLVLGGAAVAGSTDELPAAAADLLRSTTDRPFDLQQGPLWRAVLVQLTPAHHLLAVVFHHLVCDGFSRGIFLRDLALAYERFVRGEMPSAPAVHSLPTAADGCDQDARAGLARARALEWWQAQFATPVFPLRLPLAQATAVRAGVEQRSFTLPENLAAIARQLGVTPPALVLAITALSFHCHTGQTDLLFCVPLAQRRSQDDAAVMGHFNTIVPLRLQVSPAETAAAFTQSVHRRLLTAMDHHAVALTDIATLPGLARVPINRVLVSYQEVLADGLRLRDVACAPRRLERAHGDFDCTLQIEAAPGQVTASLALDARTFTAAACETLARRWSETLARVAADASVSIGDLPAHRPSRDAVARQLRAHAEINDAAVTLDDARGELTAWLVLDEHATADEASLRAWVDATVEPSAVPSQLVTVAALPRDARGAVDVRALVALRSDRVSQRAPWVAPRTALEATIATMWQRVLWLEQPVGVDDDFRTLGGHSLLSVRMIAELERALDTQLPVHVLRRLSTVGALAAAIEAARSAPANTDPARAPLDDGILRGLYAYVGPWAGARRREGSLLIGRNTAGARPPLFWCLQSEHELDQLAKHFPAEQPVYGMRSGHEVMVKDAENIARLAAYYAAEIDAEVPAGPLLIGGNCQGAVIAFEVATGLRARGRDVPVLFLHEKLVPKHYGGRIAMTFGRDGARNPYRQTADPEAMIRGYHRGPFSLDLVAGTHGHYFDEPNIQDLVRVLCARRDEVVS